MCLAVPGRVIKIRNNDALVEFSSLKRKANISLLKNVKVGDYVLIHVGYAIQKVDKKTAMETYRLLDDIKKREK